jgi:hypothetical protein
MSQLPFFTWHNILCAAAECGAACFLPVRAVAKHKNMHYARQNRVCSARLLRFGEMFQWRKSLVCHLGARHCQLHLRHHRRRLLRQQMAALILFIFIL